VPGAAPRSFPIVPFSAADVDGGAFHELRAECLQWRFLPAFRSGIVLDIGVVDPERDEVVRAVRRLTHREVRRFGISRPDFEAAAAALGPAPDGRAAEPPRPRGGCPIPDAWDLAGLGPRAVAVQLVGIAFAAGASDLLLDEQEGWLDVAMKLGGRKEILPPVERAFAAPLLKVFKELAGLPTHAAESWLSGAASVALPDGARADLRIELTPTVHGQSLVARIQDRRRLLDRMRALPFRNPAHLRLAEACLAQKQGLVIATGPTGQGKTSTLYACLGRLDRSSLNIRTLEDPVEFPVPWITQIPVGAGTGRRFGDGLRSLLRQAPHVILMGEIRDAEVARTCIEAVDTGHLILATLHTRDAIEVVARLLDLGVTGRQIASSLLLSIGQRLVRRLCPACRRPVPVSPLQAAQFEGHGVPVPGVLFEPGGCAACGGTGFSGMTPLFELFHPGLADELEEAVGRADCATYREDRLRSAWIARGGEPLAIEGLRLAAEGATALGETAGHGRRPLL
jgi:general secretion pathway protein E